MKIGLSAGGTLERMVQQGQEAERDGFSSLWFAGGIGLDPLSVIAVVGQATETVELGTSVVQSYPRHPVAMAQSASTAAAAAPGRFTLGIGVSHRPAIEAYGYSYDRPAGHLREYIEVMGAVLRGEGVAFSGDHYRVRMARRVAGTAGAELPVLVAALGPVMLRLAGELTSGTITWMANRRAIETFVAPRLRAASEAAGRADAGTRIVVGLPVAVCDDADEGRAVAATQFAGYGQLPNYQRILAAGAAEGPGDAAIVGDEKAVEAELRALLDAGATDIWAAVFPVGEDRSASRRRTRALLKDLAKEA